MSPLTLPSWVWHTTTTTSYTSDPKGALRRDVSARRLFGMVLFSNTHEESVGDGARVRTSAESVDADVDADVVESPIDVEGVAVDVGEEPVGGVVVATSEPPVVLAERSRQGSSASHSGQRYETRRHSDAAVARAEV